MFRAGTHVKAGDVIGYEGDSGRSTGPHLHYEVRIYNTPVNPWRYLRTVSPTHTSTGEPFSEDLLLFVH